MWRYLYILMIAVLLSMCSWGRGMAADVIAGRVVSVDREHRQIILDPLETDKDRVVITFEHGRIPSGLQAGELIRVKGDFTMAVSYFRSADLPSEIRHY